MFVEQRGKTNATRFDLRSEPDNRNQHGTFEKKIIIFTVFNGTNTFAGTK
jgi:hypothetical protein